jgi:hypothetical protein
MKRTGTSLVAGLLMWSGLASQTLFNSGMLGSMDARQFGPGSMSGRISAIEGVNADEGKNPFCWDSGWRCLEIY